MFSIDDLRTSPNQTTHWDGVRNYQARNFIRDEMSIGDHVFFYHSNCTPPGIIGIAEITSEPYVILLPLIQRVSILIRKVHQKILDGYVEIFVFKEKFKDLIPLDELKHYPELEKMPLVRRGNRLSVLPVSRDEWNFITEELRHNR